jgi:hypothetical protein
MQYIYQSIISTVSDMDAQAVREGSEAMTMCSGSRGEHGLHLIAFGTDGPSSSVVAPLPLPVILAATLPIALIRFLPQAREEKNAIPSS